MVTFILLQSLSESAKSHVIHVMRASVVYVTTCQTRANFSFLRADVPINVRTCQSAKGVPFIRLRLPKDIPIFELFFKRIFQFFNFSIMLNICKFQGYLGISRKFISRNKEFKFQHLSMWN